VTDRLRAAGCVFAEDEAALLLDQATSLGELESMVSRRAAGVPLEHVLGWVEFAGLRVEIDPGVFVPRRRTEYLVEQAVARTAPGAVVVDLCCGCAAIGLAIARAVGDSVELHAADIDPVAVACARRNVSAVGGQVYVGDLYDALPRSLRGRVDTLAVNTPYVPSAAIAFMPPEARDFEPLVALDGGPDGLDVARRVAADAAHWLGPGGWLLIESSERQATALAQILAGAGLTPAVASGDNATVVLGQLPAG
jgi:release factor glutamine methyltransferase